LFFELSASQYADKRPLASSIALQKLYASSVGSRIQPAYSILAPQPLLKAASSAAEVERSLYALSALQKLYASSVGNRIQPAYSILVPQPLLKAASSAAEVERSLYALSALQKLYASSVSNRIQPAYSILAPQPLLKSASSAVEVSLDVIFWVICILSNCLAIPLLKTPANQKTLHSSNFVHFYHFNALPTV